MGSVKKKKEKLAEECFKVYKRVGVGQLTFVNTYTVSDVKDLGDCDNIESFIKKHIVPMYGVGRYQIKAVSEYGQELNAREVIIAMHKPLKVYVAGPLMTSGAIDHNIREAIDVAYYIKEAGALPFVPHLYFFWDLMRPMPREFWLELDKMWVEDSDVVFRLPGDSIGADLEEGWAEDKPVFHQKRTLFDFIKEYNEKSYVVPKEGT